MNFYFYSKYNGKSTIEQLRRVTFFVSSSSFHIVYLRVDNISFDTFKISKNLCIAQMVFEQLSSKPIHTYDQQVNASFNNEWQYKGLSHYKDNYEERTTKE